MADERDPKIKDEVTTGKSEKEAGGFQTTLSRWLRRLIIILLIFVMLVAVAWFALIGPRNTEVTQLQSELSAANAQIESLEAQNADVQSLKAQRSILSLLVDANLARFELARDDKEAAADALADTGNTLYQLSLELGEEYDETIADLETRLELARESIVSETDLSSMNDLEVFVTTLQTLLQELLSE